MLIGNSTKLPDIESSVTDLTVDKKETTKGTKYTVGFVFNFLNSLPISIQMQLISINFWLYYENVPVLNVSNSGTVELITGMNSWSIEAESTPEYTEELMRMVGRLSEGSLYTDIVIKDIKLMGRDCDQDLKDLFQAKEFKLKIPPLDTSLLQKLRNIN